MEKTLALLAAALVLAAPSAHAEDKPTPQLASAAEQAAGHIVNDEASSSRNFASDDRPAPAHKRAAIITGVIGAVFAAAGAGMLIGAHLEGTAGINQASTAPTRAQAQAGVDRAEQADKIQYGGFAVFGVGAVCIAVALGLVIYDHSHNPNRRLAAARSSP